MARISCAPVMKVTSIIRHIGFLADTHSRKADGSDLPQQALDAFEGVDLIVHLGDIGQKGILDRLAKIAPVLVPAGGNKGYVPTNGVGDVTPIKVIEAAGGSSVGLTFNLSHPVTNSFWCSGSLARSSPAWSRGVSRCVEGPCAATLTAPDA